MKKRRPRRTPKRHPSQGRKPSPIFDVGGGMGPAEAMVELARPLLELAGDDIEAMNKALALAAMAWTAETLPEAERNKLLKESAEAAGIAGEDLKTFYEAIDMLMHRKRVLGIR